MDTLTEERKKYLLRRIQQLRSKMQQVGPFRQYGIWRTIQGMKQQLKNNKWDPSIR